MAHPASGRNFRTDADQSTSPRARRYGDADVRKIAFSGNIRQQVIDTEFRDFKNGQYKIISFYAKKARGLMSRFVIQERVGDPEVLKQFDVQGYYYSAEQSSVDKLVFLRDEVLG